jgi:hypothetical protein
MKEKRDHFVQDWWYVQRTVRSRAGVTGVMGRWQGGVFQE